MEASEIGRGRDSDRIFETYWPYVVSVCRASLRDAHEAEDAAQETFLKLLRREGPPPDDVRAWLAAAARTTSLDRIRRKARARRRRERWATEGHARARDDAGAAALLQHATRAKLPAALAALDPSDATLLVERYVHGWPLRALAARRLLSVATASRHTAQAVERLAAVLDELGVLGADHRALPAYLAQLGGDALADYAVDTGLRMAPSLPRPGTHPGGPRAMRVGVVASYRNGFTLSTTGFSTELSFQVLATRWIDDPTLELVAVIDPGSHDRGPVEATIREFELHAGLIDITDGEALATLDVLMLGNNFFFSPAGVRAVLGAVKAGMGLYQEGHIGTNDPGESDPDLRELMLAESPLWSYCSGLLGRYVYHSMPCPGTVVASHPAMPWLTPGRPQTLTTCGAIFKPRPHATVIAIRDEPRSPNAYGCGGHGEKAFRSPAILAGEVGRGRVLSIHFIQNDLVFGLGPRAAQRFRQTLDWLAAGRHPTPDAPR